MSVRVHDVDDALLPWSALREAAHGVPRSTAPPWPEGLRWTGSAWQAALTTEDARRPWLDLYLPVCNGGAEQPFVLGHLGQSLDGFIATSSGESRCVTGEENIRHLHRLRALCDAVIVGAGTVAADDPQLTTRLVSGPSPLRVVLDPRRRLRRDHRLFTDGAAPSLRVVLATSGTSLESQDDELLLPGQADGRLDLTALVNALAARGCRRLFVEGGGDTVSSFLAAGLLDRLHIAVAPLLIGSGRPAIRLASRACLGDCLRPPVRIYRMGADLLYDFDLRHSGAASPPPEALARVY